MRRISGRIELAILLTLAAAGAARAGDVVLQLRIENSAGGRIQARAGQGGEWTTVGSVVRPATRCVPTFPAARYTPPGALAAVAVHGLRIRLPASDGSVRGISIQPREFGQMPHRYGGHVPGPSAIVTDIPAGTGIFRELAPRVGDPVRLEKAGQPVALPADWSPAPGDVLRIESREPADFPAEIILHNRPGGEVEAVSPDGTRRRIATVVRPVRGVGRFDGTAYTGVGALNSNHGGVVTISTAPNVRPEDEGRPPESRGGFQIIPSMHARTQPVMPQSLVVGPVEGASGLEGKPPLFSGVLSLGDGSPAVDILVPGGGWQPLPAVVGKQDDAFTMAWLLRRGIPAEGDVAAVRIRPQTRTLADLQSAIRAAARSEDRQEREKGVAVWELRGPLPPGTAFAVFASEGRTLAISNVRPFRLSLDGAREGQPLSATLVRPDGSTVAVLQAIVVRKDGRLAVREEAVRPPAPVR